MAPKIFKMAHESDPRKPLWTRGDSHSLLLRIRSRSPILGGGDNIPCSERGFPVIRSLHTRSTRPNTSGGRLGIYPANEHPETNTRATAPARRDSTSFSNYGKGEKKSVADLSQTMALDFGYIYHRFWKYVCCQYARIARDVINHRTMRSTHSSISQRNASPTPRTDPHPPLCAGSSGPQSPSA